MKKMTVLLALLLMFLSLSGCGTAKGMATGMGAAAVCTAQGVEEDWNNAKKADAWMQKNLW